MNTLNDDFDGEIEVEIEDGPDAEQELDFNRERPSRAWDDELPLFDIADDYDEDDFDLDDDSDLGDEDFTLPWT